MRRNTWFALAALASGCYLSHPEDVTPTGPPAVVDDPVLPDDPGPCAVRVLDCGAEAVRRDDLEPEPEGAGWCCPYGGSLRAVLQGDECVFDTEACLPHEDLEIRRAIDIVEPGPTLSTVEGVAMRIETETRYGTEMALSLDGGIVLEGAPCGPTSEFACLPDGSCGPLELGRTYRVTGWALGAGDVCWANSFHLPGLDVVSWVEAPR